MTSAPEFAVAIVYVPPEPLTIGLRTLAITRSLMTVPPLMTLPEPLRLTVTTWPLTPAVKPPLIKVLEASVAWTAVRLKPAGKVTTILPLAGKACSIVNVTVTLPVTPAVKEAGWTFVAVKAPGVVVSAVTAVSSSITTSLESVV